MVEAPAALAQSPAAVTTDRSRIFKTAWRYARVDAAVSGRKLRAVFGDALRRAWAAHRDPHAIEYRVCAELDAQLAEIRARKEAGTFKPIRPEPWRFANTVL